MKILTININPPDRCHKHLKVEFDKLGDKSRLERILKLLKKESADIIFFTEQYRPIYNLVEKKLEHEYDFLTPKGMRSNANSGVIAAVKNKFKSDVLLDSKLYVVKSGKFLPIVVEGQYYLGIHAPQPVGGKYIEQIEYTERKEYEGYKEYKECKVYREYAVCKDYYDFFEGIKKFIQDYQPLILCGDFNTIKGTTIKFNGYKDYLPKGHTYAAKTKLDYIFINEAFEEKFNKIESDNIQEVMEKELLFSDHSVTMVELKEN